MLGAWASYAPRPSTHSGEGDAVHPASKDTPGLNRDEAVADGTALLGFDPNSGDHRTQVTAETIGQEWNRISTRLAELYAAGVADNDPQTQRMIHEHYRWLCHFWTPDRESYLRLAGMYVNQPKFRRRIERRKPRGMAAYMRDAMTAFAWSQLR